MKNLTLSISIEAWDQVRDLIDGSEWSLVLDLIWRPVANRIETRVQDPVTISCTDLLK